MRRSGGLVFLAPVVQGLKQVQTGVGKTASELAIQRLSSDIAQLKNQIKYNQANITRLTWAKKRERPEGWFDGIVMGPVGSVASLIAIGSLIGFVITQASVLLLTLLASGAVIGIMFFLKSRLDDSYAGQLGEKSDAEIRDREREISGLEKEMDAKKQEMAKHQKIVEQ